MNIFDFDKFFAETKASILKQLENAISKHDSFTFTKNSLEKTFSEKANINNSSPALYVFEITNIGKYTTYQLIKIYESIKDKSDKGFSAIGESKNKDEKTLYVGKVREGLRTRLNTHLGLANETKTQGLRLLSWLPENIEITCHCYYINNLKDDFLVDMFEEFLKSELKPILGMK